METMERGRCFPARETLARSRAERPGWHITGRHGHHDRSADGDPGATLCTGYGQWYSARVTRAEHAGLPGDHCIL